MNFLKKFSQIFLSFLTVAAVVIIFVSYLGRFSWFFDLLSHFRVYYLVGLWLLALLLLCARRLRQAAVVVLLCFFQVASILPYYIPLVQSYPVDKTTPDTQKLMFSNVHYDNNDSLAIVKLVKKYQPDIILFAEMNPELFDSVQEELQAEYPHSFYKNGRYAFDLAIFTKIQPADQIRVHYFGQNQVPALEMNLFHSNKQFSVILSHPYSPLTQGSHQKRNAELRSTAEYIAQKNDPSILIGDLNTTSWSSIFSEIKNTAEMKDTRAGTGVLNTWPAGLPEFFRIPIDHALVTKDIQVHSREVLESIGISDHLPILLEISL